MRKSLGFLAFFLSAAFVVACGSPNDANTVGITISRATMYKVFPSSLTMGNLFNSTYPTCKTTEGVLHASFLVDGKKYGEFEVKRIGLDLLFPEQGFGVPFGTKEIGYFLEAKDIPECGGKNMLLTAEWSIKTSPKEGDVYKVTNYYMSWAGELNTPQGNAFYSEASGG